MKKVKPKFVCVCVGLCLLFAVVAPQASAYEELAYHAEGTLTLVPYSGFSTATRTGIRESTNKWNVASGKTKLLTSSSTHSKKGNFRISDSQNGIWKVPDEDDIVGCTYPTSFNMSTGAYYEVDVNLNSNANFANSAQPGCYDSYTTILHELGHVLGLKDLYLNTDLPKVMYYHAFKNCTRRDLTSDDRAGAKYLAQKY